MPPPFVVFLLGCALFLVSALFGHAVRRQRGRVTVAKDDSQSMHVIKNDHHDIDEDVQSSVMASGEFE